MSGNKIGSNIASLRAQRRLGEATASVASALEKLSSGLRINKAADDSAGLAIAEALNAKSRIFGQAIRNINDGISFVSIAEAAMGQLAAITTRQREIAEQAANGAYTSNQRQTMQVEVDALVAEYNRIIVSSKFNGISIFGDGDSPTQLNIQAGIGFNNILSTTIDADTQATIIEFEASGTFQAGTTYAVGATANSIIATDLNNDGHLDISSMTNAGTVANYLNNGAGVFTYVGAAAGMGNGKIKAVDIDEDGNLDLVSGNVSTGRVQIALGNGNGTFESAISFASITNSRMPFFGDFNGDGDLDIAVLGVNGGNQWMTHLGNGNGTFEAGVTRYTAGAFGTLGIAEDIDGDGDDDIFMGHNGYVHLWRSDGAGSFAAAVTINIPRTSVSSRFVLGDINNDGNLDIVADNDNGLAAALGDGTGGFGTALTFPLGIHDPEEIRLTDFNGDGSLDILRSTYNDGGPFIHYGNGNGTFGAAISVANIFSASVAVGDFNGDGVGDFAHKGYSNAYLSVVIQDTVEVEVSVLPDVTTVDSAREAITTLETQANRISASLGNLGAFQSRLAFAVQHAQSVKENYEQAYSRIMSVDVAEESARLIQKSILQQAATAILAQANQSPKLVLQLLSIGE